MTNYSRFLCNFRIQGLILTIGEILPQIMRKLNLLKILTMTMIYPLIAGEVVAPIMKNLIKITPFLKLQKCKIVMEAIVTHIKPIQ